jgi:hypothetical protein
MIMVIGILSPSSRISTIAAWRGCCRSRGARFYEISKCRLTCAACLRTSSAAFEGVFTFVMLSIGGVPLALLGFSLACSHSSPSAQSLPAF